MAAGAGGALDPGRAEARARAGWGGGPAAVEPAVVVAARVRVEGPHRGGEAHARRIARQRVTARAVMARGPAREGREALVEPRLAPLVVPHHPGEPPVRGPLRDQARRVAPAVRAAARR